MKKILVSLLTICLAAMSVQVSAEAYTDEQGVVYEVSGASGKVTGYIGKLPNIVIPSPVKITGTEDEFYVTTIGKDAFSENTYLECITLPEDLEIIDEYAFYKCTMLYRVVFAEGTRLQEIKNRAFSDCTGLIDIEIPAYTVKEGGETTVYPKFRSTSSTYFYNFQGVPNIGYKLVISDTRRYPKGYDSNWGARMKNGVVEGYLLYPTGDTGKTDLRFCSQAAKGSIVIPESTTSIRSQAFADCKKISSIVIPGTISSIESRVFIGCSGLTSLVCKCETPPVSAYYSDKSPEFDGVDKSIPVYVPETSIDKYKAADGWKLFTNYKAWSKEEEEQISKCTLTLTVNDPAMGSVTGAGTYDGGSDVTIEAKANDGYKFVQWSDNVVENPRQLKVTSDLILTAIFASKDADPDKFIVTLLVNDEKMGEVSGAGTYDRGATVIVEAKAKEGYKFVKWNDENKIAVRTFIIDKNIALTAIFEAIAPAGQTFTITASANDASMGTVQGAGQYAENAEVKLLAIPNEGYKFVKWSDGDTSNPRVFKATADAAFVAEFEKKPDEPSEEGLDDVLSTDYKVRKTFIDGQLYIIRADGIYDARGARVK